MTLMKIFRKCLQIMPIVGALTTGMSATAFAQFSFDVVPDETLERQLAPNAKLIHPAFAMQNPESQRTLDHSQWTMFLTRHVYSDENGIHRIPYASIVGQDRQILKTYLEKLQKTEVRRLNRAEQLAYWINLYNAVTIDIVLDHYPLLSIREIRKNPIDFVGPMNDKRVNVIGMDLTLDNIYHGILRPVFKDARIHYALSCAAIGCANIGKQAYVGGKIDEQLDRAAHNYVNDPRGVSVKGDTVFLSKIYLWYREDFGKKEADIIDHIQHYAQDGLRIWLNDRTSTDGYHDYDWTLNDGRKPRRPFWQFWK